MALVERLRPSPGERRVRRDKVEAQAAEGYREAVLALVSQGASEVLQSSRPEIEVESLDDGPHLVLRPANPAASPVEGRLVDGAGIDLAVYHNQVVCELWQKEQRRLEALHLTEVIAGRYEETVEPIGGGGQRFTAWFRRPDGTKERAYSRYGATYGAPGRTTYEPYWRPIAGAITVGVRRRLVGGMRAPTP